MEKHEYNKDMDMLFTAAHDWHADIWLPGDAQISEIHIRVYSFTFPDTNYGIAWGHILPNGNRLQIPIDASKPGHSSKREAVRLAIDITYYSADQRLF
jgi:hypothetical protein